MAECPTGNDHFFWIHKFPGSFPSASGGALWPDSGPYASSSVPSSVSLWRLPEGPADAPLWTASFLDQAQFITVYNSSQYKFIKSTYNDLSLYANVNLQHLV
jgi:hypothetical protein